MPARKASSMDESPETSVVPMGVDISPFVEPPAYVHAPPVPPVEDVSPAESAVPPKEFWAQLIETLRTNKMADQTLAAELHAHAMKKALRPENDDHPEISAYNPRGDRDFPRPRPTQAYYLGPYPIASPQDYLTVTMTELELLARLQAGSYQVTKTDNSTALATVQVEMSSDGKTPYRTTIRIPMANDEQKANWPPLAQLLMEIVTGESPSTSITKMQRRIAELEQRLAVTAA